jgi:trans-2,3-dihydro-3-hydroxyanthranilate isomerase
VPERKRRFAVYDVFSSKRLAGNPLAVVFEPEGLDDAAMQAIAGEFNLSETVFVLPPGDAAHRARLRIFTPTAELPFAGHPTVGAAVLLARLDAVEQQSEITLGETIGPVRCTVSPARGGVGSARFALPRLPEYAGAAAAPGDIAAARGLAVGDLGCEDYAPGRWSAGVGFTMVPVRGLDAMRRARPDTGRWDAAFGRSGPHRAAFLFCRETVEAGHAFHARMFAPPLGIAEDPATGSAVANLAGMVARHGGLGDGEHELPVEQGYEMGRPSVLRLGIVLRGGALAGGSIGGDAVLVSEGTIEA